MMQSDQTVYLIAGGLLILLVFLRLRPWSDGKTTAATPKPPRAKREPKLFAGYTRKPECELCEQGVAPQPPMPGSLTGAGASPA